MHLHHADIRDDIELGIRSNVRFSVDAGGGVPASIRQIENASSGPTTVDRPGDSAEAADEPAGPDHLTGGGDEGPDTPTDSTKTAKEAVEEIAKDGKVEGDAEKAAATGAEQAEAAVELHDEISQRLREEAPGEAEWTQDRAELEEGPSLERIDESLEGDISDATEESLEQLRDEREDAEAVHAGYIEDRTTMIGALEVERTNIEAEMPESGEALKAEYEDDLRTFLEQGGMVYEGHDWFGNDYNTLSDLAGDSELPWTELIQEFEENPERVADLASHQHTSDTEDAKSREEVAADLVADGDLDELDAYEQRVAAAERLAEFYELYSAAESGRDEGNARIAEIEERQATLREFNELDRAVLSQETLDELDARLGEPADIADASGDAAESSGSDETGDVAETEPAEAPDPQLDEDGVPTVGLSRDDALATYRAERTGMGGYAEQAMVDAAGQRYDEMLQNDFLRAEPQDVRLLAATQAAFDDAPATDGSDGAPGEGAGEAEGSDQSEGAGEAEVETGGAGEVETPAQVEVAIDYTDEARRAEVLAAAQEQGFVPAEHVTVGDDGNVSYQVQPGDHYWGIAERSSGPGGFDSQVFANTMNANATMLRGLDPNAPTEAKALIHPGEQVQIIGRSIDDLVALMGLPTVELVDAETTDEEPAAE